MIGENIKELRKQTGISQEKLAEKIGVPRGTLSSWELDDSSPNPKMLIKLKEALNCSYEELILGGRELRAFNRND